LREFTDRLAMSRTGTRDRHSPQAYPEILVMFLIAGGTGLGAVRRCSAGFIAWPTGVTAFASIGWPRRRRV